MDSISATSHGLASDLFRREGARLVAILAGQLGLQHLQLAEDAVQEALVRALQTWPYRGIPDRPEAWLAQTARNIAFDHLRRLQNWDRKRDAIATARPLWMAGDSRTDPAPEIQGSDPADETVRMLFVCAHPQLSEEARVALALRTLCGFSPAEIASAFLTTEASISKRLVRARQRIRELGLPFELSPPDELTTRLGSVHRMLYLLFNEGYRASSGDQLVRAELCHEALRLGLELARHPTTARPETLALVALMLFNAARLPSRTDDAGNPLRLDEQDRSRWNSAMIQRGLEYLAMSRNGPTLSPYHLEAAIAACHSTAPCAAATDWARILSLYDRLLELDPSPVAAFNRAVAVARTHGAGQGLEALDAIRPTGTLDNYLFHHAVRGVLAAEAGRTEEARRHLEHAISLTSLPGERTFLLRQLQALHRRPDR